MTTHIPGHVVPPQRTMTPLAPPVGLILSDDAATLPHAEALSLWTIDGTSLMERSIASLRQGGCQSIVVVTGADGRRAGAAAHSQGARFAWNPFWTKGLGSALWFGVGTLSTMCLPGTLIVVAAVEHLGLTPGTVRRVIEAWRPSCVVQTKFRGRPALPIAMPLQELESVSRFAFTNGLSPAALTTLPLSCASGSSEHRAALQWIDACGATATGSILQPGELREQMVGAAT